MHSWQTPTAMWEDCTRWPVGSPQACCAFRLTWEIQELPVELHPYWTFHEELTIEDGLVLNNNRIVISSSECDDILKQIHCGLLGIQICQLRARKTVYWPGFSKAIENIVSNCETCLKFSANNRKQSPDGTLGHEIPTIPWSNGHIHLW